jgi:dolichol-phosphate mannosyltransferase
MNDLASPIRSPASIRTGAPVLSIVVPTFNECGNLGELVRRVDRALPDTTWEMIVVDDDSPDGTAAAARAMARQDPRVRCLQRIGRRGLSSACIEGMMASAAPYIAVMDADLQHDEALLAKMLSVLQRDDADIVVGSRYAEGGGVGEWSAERARASRVATRLGQAALRVRLSDPMSGFFMLRADAAHAAVRGLSGIGFKILLDLLASSPKPLRCRELPYEFRQRVAGESKLDGKVAWDFLMLLADKTIGRFVPVRFVMFGLVGSLGVFVHLAVLAFLFQAASVPFIWAQAGATLFAMTFNFAVNNALTYRDQRLRGALALLRGWVTFVAACSVGAAANVGIANYLFEQDTFWIVSAMAGVAVGAVWNYAVTSVYTWRAR